MGFCRNKKKYKYRSTFLAAIVILLTFVLILYSEQNYKISFPPEIKSNFLQTQTKYLINTTNCKIANIDPFNDEVSQFIKIENYRNCTNKPLLTYIEKSSTNSSVKLKINKSVIFSYSGFRITCCYSNITRSDADKRITYSKCQTFHDEVEIFYPFVRVICKNLFYAFYKNVHATFIPINNSAAPTYMQPQINKNAYKIFIVGIDSVSRINLQRSMLKTYNYLENNYIGLRGYNKIEENTFPNLISILTGRSYDGLVDSPCDPNGIFDKCDFIWKRFKDNLGYTTAFGEDEPEIDTFNYLKKGFENLPTDFYMRPYFIAAYKLRTFYDYLDSCTGPENPAERVLNGAKDFEITMKQYRTFSFFWMNSFSHNNFNLPSAMDGKFYEFLTDPDLLNVTHDSIVIILSDHGFRFGNIRYTYTGRMEDRLPFLYVKFPKRFIENNPKFYRNFIQNAESRLVTPFDLHMTLQHLLKLADNKTIMEPCIGCSKCHTLFEEIPENRSCSDACIDQLWCTCGGYYFIDNKEKEAVTIANFIIYHINSIIENNPIGRRLCSSYALKKIWSIGRTKQTNMNKNQIDDGSFTYLIILETSPKAMFEANVHVNGTTNKIDLLNSVKRINRYKFDSSCVKYSDGNLQIYCFCNNWSSRIVEHFLSLFHINVA